MRRLFLFNVIVLFFLMLLSSCGSTYTVEALQKTLDRLGIKADSVKNLDSKQLKKLIKQKEKEFVAQNIINALDKREYSIDITRMYPRRIGMINVNGGYSLEVRNDSVFSYLPYFGVAYNVPYGGGNGLNFVSPILYYEDGYLEKGLYCVEIDVDLNNDYIRYHIEVYDNGNTTIYVESRNRESISYDGNFVYDLDIKR